jgi:cobalt/nickel transport system permease protein
VYKAKPEILLGSTMQDAVEGTKLRHLVLAFLVVALVTGGVVSWFASENPDGLEWSIAKVTGREDVERGKTGVHGALAGLQEKLAFLPGYSFKKSEEAKHKEATPEKVAQGGKLGTSVSGIIGGLITLALAFAIGFVLKKRSRDAKY